MIMNIFQTIKAQVSCYDVLKHFNVPKKHGEMNYNCPLHKDENPSFSVFNDGEVFKCHSCQAFGDSLELYSKISGKSKGASIQEIKTIFKIKE